MKPSKNKAEAKCKCKSFKIQFIDKMQGNKKGDETGWLDWQSKNYQKKKNKFD